MTYARWHPLRRRQIRPRAPPRLREALRGAASALKENGPPFALAGSYALWAYGATEPSLDVDVVVAESDVASAEATLTDAGFSIEHPPEDWLFKARTGDTVVDVPHRRRARRVGDPGLCRTVRRAGNRDAGAAAHHGDFGKLLPAGRAIRERLDWDRVKSECADNDYAFAFLVLAQRLGLTG